MSYELRFVFTAGLKAPLHVPAGTYAAIMAHVAEVEAVLRLERDERPSSARWKQTGVGDTIPDIEAAGRDLRMACEDAYLYGSLRDPSPDDLACAAVERHNRWVRNLWIDFGEWSKNPVTGGEELTPELAVTFWHALQELDIPVHRWTRAYYRARMETVYDVMRGQERDGIKFDARKLSPEQAAAVINLFSEYLDDHDLRLDVPKGRDYLASSYDGGYDWCERCGAIAPDDWPHCKRREKCPIIAELCEEDRREILGLDKEEDEEQP